VDASHEGGLERWVKNGFLPWGEQEKSGEIAVVGILSDAVVGFYAVTVL